MKCLTCVHPQYTEPRLFPSFSHFFSLSLLSVCFIPCVFFPPFFSLYPLFLFFLCGCLDSKYQLTNSLFFNYLFLSFFLPFFLFLHLVSNPKGSSSRGGDAVVYVNRACPLFVLFCSCVYFCHYDSYNCISCRKFSRQLSVFSLFSSGLTSASLVLSTIYLFMKVSYSPDIIRFGWLGWKHLLTN